MPKLVSRVYTGPPGKHRFAGEVGKPGEVAVPGRTYEITEACALRCADRFSEPVAAPDPPSTQPDSPAKPEGKRAGK